MYRCQKLDGGVHYSIHWPRYSLCLAGNDTLQTLKRYLIYISENFSYVLL